MSEHPEIMKMMMNPDGSDDSDFSEVLHGMARDNEEVTKQIAENLLSTTGKGTQASLKALEALKKFL